MRREELCERHVFQWGNENEKYPSSASAVIRRKFILFFQHAISPQTTALATTNDATVAKVEQPAAATPQVNRTQ